MIPIRDFNPTTRQPYVTVLLIAACILAFLWQMSLDPRAGQMAVFELGFVPALLFGQGTSGLEGGLVPAWTTLFTSMFLHGGFMHLAGNMLYLWIFGNNIEDVMGHGRYLVFYLVCGLA
ncbi:MAG: rhomboid family intramembrane serine protease, partial [Geminicoccaceae bacterium]